MFESLSPDTIGILPVNEGVASIDFYCYEVMG
jgi:hypothetical protein